MRYALVLMLLSAVFVGNGANAMLIDIEFTAEIAPDAPNNWLGAGPVPSLLTGSFQIDTSVFSSASYTFKTGDITRGGSYIHSDEPILTAFSLSGLRRSNARLYADGVLLAEELAAADVFDWAAPNDGELYGSNGWFPLFGSYSLDFGVFPNWITQEQFLASSDPIALLLLNYRVGSVFSSSGSWGRVMGAVSVNAHPVPESGTFGLAGIGLVLFGLERCFSRRRRSRSSR